MRPVLLALHHKRGRNSLGYLVVAMQPHAVSGVSADALATLTTLEARAALEELEGRSELHVSFHDGWLKARDPRSGIRDFEAVDALARGIGLRLLDDVAMPANNRCLVWRRDSAPAPRPPNR